MKKNFLFVLSLICITSTMVYADNGNLFDLTPGEFIKQNDLFDLTPENKISFKQFYSVKQVERVQRSYPPVFQLGLGFDVKAGFDGFGAHVSFNAQGSPVQFTFAYNKGDGLWKGDLIQAKASLELGQIFTLVSDIVSDWADSTNTPRSTYEDRCWKAGKHMLIHPTFRLGWQAQAKIGSEMVFRTGPFACHEVIILFRNLKKGGFKPYSLKAQFTVDFNVYSGPLLTGVSDSAHRNTEVTNSYNPNSEMGHVAGGTIGLSICMNLF